MPLWSNLFLLGNLLASGSDTTFMNFACRFEICILPKGAFLLQVRANIFSLYLVALPSTLCIILIYQNACTIFYSIASPLSYAHQTEVTSVENLAASNDEVVSVSPSEEVTQPLELPKPDPVVQQGPHYPYPPPAASYAGFGLMPQLSGGQYGYETQDSQPPDFSRLPSLMVQFLLCRIVFVSKFGSSLSFLDFKKTFAYTVSMRH